MEATRILMEEHRVIERVRPSYERYEFHLAFQALHHFCAVDLSALYLDILKDRTPPGWRRVDAARFLIGSR